MLVLSSSTRNFAEKEAGGKGFSLYLASSLGFQVPPWAIIGRSEFIRFLEESKIEEKLDAALRSFELNSTTADETEYKIQELFTSTGPTKRIKSLVEQASELVGLPVAIRSSSADEDGQLNSFAGQLSTYLNISSLEEAVKATIQCFASGFSGRSLIYRREKKLALSGIQIAVVVQRMLNPDISGVLFTCDPVAMNTKSWVVSATPGVGEGLVSGAVDADTFWISSDSGEILTQEAVPKLYKISNRINLDGTEKVPVDPSEQNKPSLAEGQLLEIHVMGQRLTRLFELPLDVEWAFSQNTLYLLQTRPVTTLSRNISGFPNLWDNSNIVESYGGITLPLSFSFALNNYRVVYQQFCEVLGVPSSTVREMDSYLRNMLGIIKGRVYYNLYNWYKLIGLLPGVSTNSEFMETMMGVSEKLSGEIAARIQPHPSWGTWRGSWRKARAAIRFVYYHLRIQSIVDGFLARFNSSYGQFRTTDYSSLPSDVIFQRYLEMERVMIGDWKAPIINDLLCMVHFGILRKLTAKWLNDAKPALQNDLLAGEGNLESTEPTKELMRLAGVINQDIELKRLIEQTPLQLIPEALKQSRHLEFSREIERYLERFGHRCMNEMKLEEIDLLTDSSYLFVCLKNYLRAGTTSRDLYEERETSLRQGAEAVVNSQLSGLRLLIYKWSLRNTRRAVRNRENTRFARTRAYGIARKMFQAIGSDLSKLDILESDRDIFYLTIEEVYGIHQGTLTTTKLKELVRLRKGEYLEHLKEEPDPRFVTRGIVYWRNQFNAPAVHGDLSVDADLQGLPCCPGVVEGIVRVVASPSEDLNLNGEILVAHRTDPGWVPLYPSISALLIERGSLLSHSAIVAREMGLPTIVSIPGLISRLQTGMRVRVDGEKGTIKLLEQL